MSRSLRRLALGVLMPGFEGRTVPNWLARAIDEGLGGVCFFGHNISPEPADTRALSDDLHRRGLRLIAVDEEGGTVSRLGVHAGSPHLGAAALGVIDDPAVTASVAAAIGADVRAVGIDLDFAPVSDVDNNPANPVIGIRSFGPDPQRVAGHVAAAVRGLQSQGVAACAKHFPGHGDTAVDSHLGLPRIDHPMQRLEAVELLPFRAAVAAGVQAVMTAHIVFGALDPHQPATTSPAALRLLRDDLGFEGLIVTDALDMRAIRDGMGTGEGCVRALLAGADVIALGNSVFNDSQRDAQATLAEAVTAIHAALRSGRLDPARLQEAAERWQRTRAWLDQPPASEVPVATPSDETAYAAESLVVRGRVRARPGPLRVVDVRRVRNIAAGARSDVVIDELVRRRPGSQVVRAFAGGRTTEGQAGDGALPVAVMPADAVPADADVVLTGPIGVDPDQDAMAELVLARGETTVLVCAAGDDRARWSAGHAVIRTGGHSRPTAVAVADLLAPR